MIKKILIIRLSSIGDVMHCTPVAKALKTTWPDCHITWLVGEVCAELIKYNPYVDEYIVWSRERFEKYCRNYEFKEAWSMWQELMKRLSVLDFYAVLDIHGLFLTGLIASKIKAERRIGLKDAKELNFIFMGETVKPSGRHMTKRYMSILQPFGIVTNSDDMTLIVPNYAQRFAAKILSQAGIAADDKVVVLVPGTTWSTKNWPTEFFAETANLIEKDFKIVLCGGQSEIELGRKIESKVHCSVINTIGQTDLLEMAAILQCASVVVAGDTGPLHMAAALKLSTVVIFGPSDPECYKPLGSNSITLFYQQKCSFCHKQKCPTGKNDCMKKVRPGEVAAAIYKLVGV
ncbi:MAG: glycosyltransferase family 9 protein [Acidaminococcaceae bacterium]|nr:glycosyltransferase family 9 protein [Acidaminococcaceae bacterium]MDD4721597.1 glycosyltransferase family 9 protein [Acidaminococcaceae bacterium]